ncbi:acetate kinase [Neolewinella xylanilytica]|uniref:Acetate kinase n=1 Tax=Neolewinella xylanilytica TaxID=1514080 RepID=A0A2S6I2B6_9BACT|nr:acetate/propionate family kinase [Neolewinella xylanilytica]PPK85293.1 acetate kinase [Neolewinella xylanilytica]
MLILVLNAGSSSLKASVMDATSGEVHFEMNGNRLLDAPELTFSDGTEIHLQQKGHEEALRAGLTKLKELCSHLDLAGTGHRVVHGGETFDCPARITDKVEQKIEALSDLAPLHNPINLEGIRMARRFFPDIPHFAVFDTSYHHSLPRRARTYALPRALAEEYGIRRYGFHGISHKYVAGRAATFLKDDYRNLRLISCHLGNGCSVAAIEFGRSIETSMGMTPLEGLVMGTRSGDLDPGILTMLAQKADLSAARIDEILNRESGLKGLSGSNDMRDVLVRSTGGDEGAQLALQIFTHRLRKYIGAYTAVMGGVDAIIFTGGVGENSSIVRHRAAQRLDYLGAIIDEDRNQSLQLTTGEDVIAFNRPHSRVKLLAIRTDEQFAIAKACGKLIDEENKVNRLPSIPVAVSARHCHLTRATLDQLFGVGHELTVKKWLSQPGQFAANETVTVIGPKNQLERVRILGPLRSVDQVEISRTDEFFLGIDAPVRESGKVDNTPGCRLVGPSGHVDLENGLICAWRHIHMTPDDASRFGVADRDVVEVAIRNDERGLTFGNVLVRVSPDYLLEMHIDTDEGNAAEITPGDTGALMHSSAEGQLKRKAVSFY